jgi:ATP-binding cassette subfamily C (CFTR/MRP) protein 4
MRNSTYLLVELTELRVKYIPVYSCWFLNLDIWSKLSAGAIIKLALISKGLIVSSVFAAGLQSVFFHAFSLVVTKKIHMKALDSVIKAKIRFFDLNPTGRILNRFSKDIKVIDDILPMKIYVCLFVSTIITF